MGLVKRFLMEMEDNPEKVRLSEILGISYLELDDLKYNIDIDKDEDGDIYNIRIRFSEDNPPEIMSKIDDLQDGNFIEIDPCEFEDIEDFELYFEKDFEYDFQFEAILEDSEYYKKYKFSSENTRKLIHLDEIENNLKILINKQVYISIITNMETFLSEAFITIIFSDEKYIKNFVSSFPNYQDEKIKLSEIFIKMDTIRSRIRNSLLDIIYHNLPVVKNMYQSTFEITFPDISNITKYVLTRHDLVHRNGKNREGKEIKFNTRDLVSAIDEIDLFISELNDLLPNWILLI